MIVATPVDDPPVTVVGDPVEPTVAIKVLLLLHVPPRVRSDKLVVPVPHIEGVPLITPGVPYTVTVVVAEQPGPVEYTIAIVPAPPPVTIPVVLPIVPDPAALHVPPVVASVKLVVRPLHTVRVPVIIPGNAFTVTILVAVTVAQEAAIV